jgi:hypothetical protein
VTQTSAGTVGQHNLRSISYESPCAIGDTLSAMSPAALASITWVANLGLFVPFQNLYRSTIYEVSWQTAVGTGGNVDVGIYDFPTTSTTANRLTSLGTTSRGAASSVIYTSTFTDYTLDPGWYYLAFSCDSAVTFNGTALAAGLYRACGVMQNTAAFVLGSTVTLAATSNAILPLINLSLASASIT